LVSGHRRRAAAELAGRDTVPLVSLGPLTDAEAAALVFARNRHRKDFGPYHEAQALATLQRLQGGSVRELAAAHGYSHGRAGILLQAARAFDAATVAAVGGGDADRGAAAVGALSYRALRDLVALADDSTALITAARRAAKLEAPPSEPSGRSAPSDASTAVDARADATSEPTDLGPPVAQHRRPGGGYLVTVARTPDAASPEDAEVIAQALERLAARYRRRARRDR
jgi:ParB-like chromosome segregation protein Spo0J